ncbi:N-acetyltransferase [Chryseotalea sanaruensis]|uniref:N-acetyltransferase n=1 Tax=Chryseotalea sanaruensis TaxID=2482724 RepID=A0A401U9Q9_9BACT|nr:GNAT family N-acetyltransferase [Chryseotalea sanaruensis]GCC51617.1 N-acetyltransferase [Chryseotalea sanaruensis]
MTLQNPLTLLASGINIRKAGANDAAKLAAIGKMTFAETFAHANTKEDMQQYVSKAFTEKQLLIELEEPGTIFLMAFERDRLAGYAKLRSSKNPSGLNSNKALELQRIYARQSYQGKKVGKQLMEYSLEMAKAMGFDTLWLGVWEYNPRAIAFYEKWGFEKFGEQSFTLGYDTQTDILMKKRIE